MLNVCLFVVLFSIHAFVETYYVFLFKFFFCILFYNKPLLLFFFAFLFNEYDEVLFYVGIIKVVDEKERNEMKMANESPFFHNTSLIAVQEKFTGLTAEVILFLSVACAFSFNQEN